MNKIKVLSVFGTRPEAIKMCPLVKKLEDDESIESIVCVTGQHREMLDSVTEIFDVKPQYDLNIMSHGQTIVDVSNKVLSGVDNVIKECKPDIVLVHGDTSTTLNAALAAFYNKIPVGHVEAGLRSGDIYSPFPEEANRKLTGAITTLHFAPTKSNRNNLLKENIIRDIHVTGNTVIDALLSIINENHKFDDEILNNMDFVNNKVILLTSHRRENWGTPMKEIFQATRMLVEKNDAVKVIFPMHKNPLVRELAREGFKGFEDKVKLIEPLEYIDFANLMSKCYLIMTDSGGVQEEAPALGKPVIVLRTETERPEAIEAGTAIVAGIEKGNIFKIGNELINNSEKYNDMAYSVNPYGDGKSCERIVKIIKAHFN
ncbi:MAG: UDP-N-acetylglucosamine 2-epimerase (non-hydrolyzing) [Clostridium sp.]|uniref:non-hydrolyzing UDP-N-acetylglucosamine 2-epimerase n=1 Tax=Clostridium sp. TaxID=1506 RepID=UPI00290C02F3|nr:UDP-N-acetylglucosamine 2-epimerase (non-hydrolyzing) [Clostridium sp.]MDU7147865.1 UDP-N-acetylglucosamine 2-epimerase (non-hydrolyzing) [Clostridium sp.]MDU7241743.1 UDP-N-acetylglucosamine 2-epimerase (non-hydrolyzing) [Clostridium sp.]